MQLTLSVLPDVYAISRLPANAPLPAWAQRGELTSFTRTAEELSVLCPQQNVPPNVQCERNWRCLKVDGPLDFALTGVLASLAGALAAAEVSLFAVSTFDTDYLLVKADKLPQAIAALKSSGQSIKNDQ